MSTFQPVVFDFDGVLADTEPLHYARFSEVVSPFGISCSWDEYQERYIGYDDRDLFRTAFRDAGIPLDEAALQDCVQAKAEAFARSVEEEGLSPYPGVLEFIDSLVAQSIPLAICSGALKSDVLPVLRAFDILRHFAVISTAEDVPVSKPDPRPYEHVVEQLQLKLGWVISKAHCLVFEDTDAGIEAARAAGLQVVGVLHGSHGAKLEKAHVRIKGFEGLTLSQIEALFAGGST